MLFTVKCPVCKLPVTFNRLVYAQKNVPVDLYSLHGLCLEDMACAQDVDSTLEYFNALVKRTAGRV